MLPPEAQLGTHRLLINAPALTAAPLGELLPDGPGPERHRLRFHEVHDVGDHLLVPNPAGYQVASALVGIPVVLLERGTGFVKCR